MEDSYTVHRRRKAAARRRDKTPDPPRRHQDDVPVSATDAEEDETRARMERMVQETERLEELEQTERRRAETEKSSDYPDSSVPDKSQRALKRATSPEIRRMENDEAAKEDEPPESNQSVELTTTSMPVVSSCSSDDRKPNESVGGKVTTRTKKHDGVIDVTPTRVVRRRTDVDNNHVCAKVIEKPGRSMKTKTLSSDREKIEKNRIVDEWKSDVGDSEDRARKTSSRADDDHEEENKTTAAAAAAASDKNRWKGETRGESDTGGATKFVSRGKDEFDKQRDLESNENVAEKGTKPAKDSARMNKKRDVTSPSKSRSSESRAGATTTITTKRYGKERNVERSSGGYTTDSSETEETTKRIFKRTKSPEGAKMRSISSRKTPNRSRANTDTDGDVDVDVDVEDLERSRKTERSSTSRRRPSSETDEDTSLRQSKRERSPPHSALDRRDAIPVLSKQEADKSRGSDKRSSSRSRQPPTSHDTDQDFKTVRKSGTFPIDPAPRDKSPSIARSSSEIKKQIIPLSDDTLIKDFERAQKEYLKKERGILDRDLLDDDYVDPKMEASLRRRKFSIVRTESEAREDTVEHVKQQPVSQRSWFSSWLRYFGSKASSKEEVDLGQETKTKIEKQRPMPEKIKEETRTIVEEQIQGPKKVSILEFFRILADFLSEFGAFIEQNPRETRTIRILRNRCIAELLLAIIYCGLGAFVFRFTEGAFETFYKCGVKRVKRDFLDSLWNFSHNMREEDWKSMARRKLMEFEEQLHTAHEAGVHSYSGQKSWSFLNAVVYCLTVITTIGYGHISPSTTTGRAITIVYAIFGIPMFLIILADFGKLFTRGIKFLWAFVRRVYYTGSCRRVRRTVPVQEVMKGVQLVYDLATFRRPSQMNPEEIEEMQKQQNQTQTVLNVDGNAPASLPGTPGTPAMSTFAIDDEFNLPISVAIIILLVYIFVGATVYNFWEQWGFFESFYFVFISMSTIGFGDYVPKHPMYMMLSIVYLVFGLALTSMCINVVQVMLSDSFKQASQKIGATIGFEVVEEDGSIQPAVPPPVELADVHATIKEADGKEQVAPKAKQEDVEL